MSNAREHWAQRARRTKRERAEALMLARSTLPDWPLPLEVTIVRVSPGTLDDDNLRGACKAIRDGIADRYGVRDNDPRIAWHYGQQLGPRGQYGLCVQIRSRA